MADHQFHHRRNHPQLRYIRPATSFRNSYAYDNLLYIVAGKIIAQKSGKTWGETVRERILKPVGMTTTTTSLAENAGNPNVANAHSKIDGKIAAVKAMPVANAVGAVGINTNAEDIARWMNVLLAGGKLRRGKDAGGKEIAPVQRNAGPRDVDRANADQDRAAQAALAATRPNFFAYGLGFQLRDYKGMKLVHARRRAAGLLFARGDGAGSEAGHRDPDQRRKRRRADGAAVSPARPVPGRARRATGSSWWATSRTRRTPRSWRA